MSEQLKKHQEILAAADAVLAEIYAILLEMRQLAENSANPEATAEQRAAWDASFQILSQRLDALSTLMPDLQELDLAQPAGGKATVLFVEPPAHLPQQ